MLPEKYEVTTCPCCGNREETNDPLGVQERGAGTGSKRRNAGPRGRNDKVQNPETDMEGDAARDCELDNVTDGQR
jgi:hypothetical protein